MRARQTIHAVQLGARRASTGGAAVLDWRSIPSPELEYHFVPRLAIPDASQTFERFAKLSAAALPSLPGPFDVAYGRDSYEVLDVHAAPPSAADPPLVVFVHGGYWRALDKRDHHFVVAGPRSSGFSVVNVNYPLAPGVSVTRICASVAAAVRFVAARREAWGLGTGALALFGHPAGAHAVAHAAAEVSGDVELAGVVEVSGIYDLRVVRELPSVQCDGGSAPTRPPRRLHGARAAAPPVYLSVGALEPAGWRADRRAARRARRRGRAAARLARRRRAPLQRARAGGRRGHARGPRGRGLHPGRVPIGNYGTPRRRRGAHPAGRAPPIFCPRSWSRPPSCRRACLPAAGLGRRATP